MEFATHVAAILASSSMHPLLTTAPPLAPVSSRGVNRGFVILFLEKLLDHTQTVARETNRGVHFPFPDHIIQDILNQCVADFTSSAQLRLRANELYPGAEFNKSDVSSYWSSPRQFRTWWKNNVERIAKFNASKRNTTRISIDGQATTIMKSSFRSVSVLTCENIRNHFTRLLSKNGGTVVTVFTIPIDKSLNALVNASSPDDELVASSSPVNPVSRKKNRIFGNYSDFAFSASSATADKYCPTATATATTTTVDARASGCLSASNMDKLSFMKELVAKTVDFDTPTLPFQNYLPSAPQSPERNLIYKSKDFTMMSERDDDN